MLKKWMICLAIFSLSGTAVADDSAEFEAFLQQQDTEFDIFQTQRQQEFETFVKRWQEAEQAYREKVASQWDDPELSGKTRLVQYSDDLKQRTVVDYEANTITVELNQDQADTDIQQVVAQQLNQLGNATVAETASQDPVLINARVAIDSRSQNQVPHRKLVPGLAGTEQQALRNVKITRDGGKVKATVQMTGRNTQEKIEEILPVVQQNAKKWGVPPALILAIVHTESSFNPLARSHIPAFGLMQIVPVSAGKDVSKELYGSQRLLSPDYLYDPEKNIQAGSVYLYLLLNRYFKNVVQGESRFYMAVSAYNTGPGNVARAMSNTTRLSAASNAANQLSPTEVYQRLQQNLPAQETRNYLTKVTKRYAQYQTHLESQP
ncbi:MULTISPECIES: transglycosylase SLT domain-containing protein [unclassified Marinobacter]|uniref:transglycosylase SLT domain-containing protein n=1 Tax=unclassified Marinobacter TaxID=83889 RepID=UPI000BF99FD1|nr:MULTISPECIES: transglycosylase SLT domain-containing protein [unclassified Marinobacter]PFG10348.1 membrane-bound lytic murein transglycosylase C [Marinobacter sp. LV10MA510-1]PFG52252.1 membrane-bound lytic murein transglycosylase C [Marinobacter sp. LV10R520-4]